MYKCALCDGKGKADYYDLDTDEIGEDVCPDCNGLGETVTDNKSLQSYVDTFNILNN